MTSPRWCACNTAQLSNVEVHALGRQRVPAVRLARGLGFQIHGHFTGEHFNRARTVHSQGIAVVASQGTHRLGDRIQYLREHATA